MGNPSSSFCQIRILPQLQTPQLLGATEHFRSSLELLPSARAHFGLGTCLGALRLRREAAEELRRAVQLCPSMVGAIINLAGAMDFVFSSSAFWCSFLG